MRGELEPGCTLRVVPSGDAQSYLTPIINVSIVTEGSLLGLPPMSRIAFPPEKAVDMAMKGFVVSDPSGSVLARSGSRYLMRRANNRIDLPIEGMSRDALLECLGGV